jgi:hypothetical protein
MKGNLSNFFLFSFGVRKLENEKNKLEADKEELVNDVYSKNLSKTF